MKKSQVQVLLPLPERVEQKIVQLRGQRVILSIHLASLYGVEPRTLIQAVKRNLSRFPEDFMFQLSSKEFENLKSQFVISSWGGMRRANPYAFTEQGVAMLSSVLRSPKAVRVNIEIMRAFVKLRQILATHADLARKIEELEKKYDSRFHIVFKTIRDILAFDATTKKKSREKIGFQVKPLRVIESRPLKKCHA